VFGGAMLNSHLESLVSRQRLAERHYIRRQFPNRGTDLVHRHPIQSSTHLDESLQKAEVRCDQSNRL